MEELSQLRWPLREPEVTVVVDRLSAGRHVFQGGLAVSPAGLANAYNAITTGFASAIHVVKAVDDKPIPDPEPKRVIEPSTVRCIGYWVENQALCRRAEGGNPFRGWWLLRPLRPPQYVIVVEREEWTGHQASAKVLAARVVRAMFQ